MENGVTWDIQEIVREGVVPLVSVTEEMMDIDILMKSDNNKPPSENRQEKSMFDHMIMEEEMISTLVGVQDHYKEELSRQKDCYEKMYDTWNEKKQIREEIDMVSIARCWQKILQLQFLIQYNEKFLRERGVGV